MKRISQPPARKRMKVEDLMATNEQGHPVMGSKQGSEKDLLLRHPNFVAESRDSSFEPPPLACEASALTTELTAQNRIYFNPKNQLCKLVALASSKFCTPFECTSPKKVRSPPSSSAPQSRRRVS